MLFSRIMTLVMPMSMNKIKVMGQRSRSRRSNQVFSCSRQLYRRLCLSVCLSVCACVCVCVCVSLTHFLPCSYHWIFIKLTPDIDPMKCLWHIQFEVKRSKVKVTRVKKVPIWPWFEWFWMITLFEFVDDYETLHRDSKCIEEDLYCFSRSSVKF